MTDHVWCARTNWTVWVKRAQTWHAQCKRALEQKAHVCRTVESICVFEQGKSSKNNIAMNKAQLSEDAELSALSADSCDKK